MVNPPTFKAVTELLNRRKGNVLLIAQASLPEHQYQAFKTLFLNELGERGLEGDLKRLLLKQQGMDGNGREYTMQERGCHHE